MAPHCTVLRARELFVLRMRTLAIQYPDPWGKSAIPNKENSPPCPGWERVEANIDRYGGREGHSRPPPVRRAPAARPSPACRAPVARLSRARRPPVARPSPACRAPVARLSRARRAPVARLPRARRAPVARLPRARRAPVARQACDKVLTDIRPSI